MGYVSRLSPPQPDTNATELWCGNKVLRLPGRTFFVSAAFSVQELGLQRIRSVTAPCLATLMRSAISQRLLCKDAVANLVAGAEEAELCRRVLVDKLSWPSFWKQPAFAWYLSRAADGDASVSPCRQLAVLAPEAAVQRLCRCSRPFWGASACHGFLDEDLLAEFLMCPQRIHLDALRLLLNGLPIAHRLHSSTRNRDCIFHCEESLALHRGGWISDSLVHYCGCTAAIALADLSRPLVCRP